MRLCLLLVSVFNTVKVIVFDMHCAVLFAPGESVFSTVKVIVFDMHCAALFAPGECLQHGDSHCLRHALRGSVCSW